jgi:exodeoxyribonuclease VII large subunit
MSRWQPDSARSGARVWGVGALVQAIGDTLAARFASCVVRGEISGFTRAASGHGYFTLKDEHGGASLRCAIFKRALGQVDFVPGEGMLVEARGNLAVYEARGELQLIVDGLQRAGAGALYEQFLRLKARLDAEGLFDAGRKRPVPAYPSRIGLVTSPKAAALHDVLTALRRRAPQTVVVLASSAVQGAEAPAQLVSALNELTLAHHGGLRLDAVIVCRGGGSLEDLWAFNDERVVRAVAGCPVPIVSGVGHETDVTLVDFVADLRAPTPTAAAELVARDQLTALAELDGLGRQMAHRLRQRLDNQAQRLDQMAARLARPAQVLGHNREQLGLLEHRLAQACGQRVLRERQALPVLMTRMARASAQELWRARQQCDARMQRLRALDPRRVLERGFAWLSDEHGRPLTRAHQTQTGQHLRGVMADGVLELAVDRVELNDTVGKSPHGVQDA